MFNIKVPEKMRVKKPEKLSWLVSVGWDYFFENGWNIFNLEDAPEGYLILDESANLENAFFLCEMDSVKDWLRHSASGLIEDNVIKTVELETYPDMFSDYEKSVENENYDDTSRVFEIPSEFFNSIVDCAENFFDTYTWDESEQIYNLALSENKIISEKIVER